ncbi:MAG: hypothetical protein U0572_00310 [Phycisphaerales bacterium]
MGKYSSWARHLDADTLEAALTAVGEFGWRYWTMKLPDGRFPAPTFQEHATAEFRMVYALESFATIRAVRQFDWQMGSGWNDEFSQSSLAFSRGFSDRLSRNPSTAWARHLDERSFALLLWMIGEYGIRVNSSRGPDGSEYAPPTFDGPPRQTEPMRAALRLIAMIEWGTHTTAAEAARVISGAAV